MSFKIEERFRSGVRSFNMTPLIDIVFLLIIFFLVVCQFIDAENFPVSVPDDCKFAESEPEHRPQLATVTVAKSSEDESYFAVGSERIKMSGRSEIVGKLAELIDARLKDLPSENRVVALRIDKDICFDEAQYALAGVAASSAVNVQLAVLKSERAELE